MRHPFANTQRVLAIDPNARGFGFIVLEGQVELIDFGLKVIRKTQDKNSACVSRIAGIIDWHQPDILVIEDYQARGCRRRLRARALLRDITTLAFEKNVRLIKVSWLAVAKAFAPDRAATKHHIAAEIAKLFPELELHLPYKRKLWTSEDYRMSMFDAAALASTAFSQYEHKA